MVMEALSSPKDNLVRHHGNLLMAPGNNSPYSTYLSTQCLHVGNARQLVAKALEHSNVVWSATNR